jgi:hypothetical protein
MPEHRDTRCKLFPTPVPAPRASDISDGKARDEDRRLKEKSEHRMHPVIPPRFLIAPDKGDIMIGTVEDLAPPPGLQ